MDSSRIDQTMAEYRRALHNPSAPWDAPLGWAENLTGVSRFKLIVIALCAVSFGLTLSSGNTVVSLVLCHAYPVYATVTLTENPEHTTTVAADARKWFTFWMLSAAILLVENHLRPVLCLVPCYTLVKTVFLVWCFAPIRHNGCEYLKAKVLRPYFGPTAVNTRRHVSIPEAD